MFVAVGVSLVVGGKQALGFAPKEKEEEAEGFIFPVAVAVDDVSEGLEIDALEKG